MHDGGWQEERRSKSPINEVLDHAVNLTLRRLDHPAPQIFRYWSFQARSRVKLP